jgi:YebC/PmpR family DNA-binding regulatory protein
MSGHNKWSSIKHKKGKADAARGRIFSRIIREITVAAKNGGGDVDSNARLRAAVTTAKAENMPADNITRAIQRGTGELPGTQYEEIQYEGYGASGVAVMLATLTDNRNRTTSEIRHIFDRHNGNLGANGCVSWMFHKKGYITVPLTAMQEDALLEAVLGAGGDDLQKAEEVYEITTAPEAFEEVKTALEAAKVPIASAEISMIPQNSVGVDAKEGEKVIRLLEAIEDHDDVQHVWANAEFTS